MIQVESIGEPETEVDFIYTGECAGACMLSIKFDQDHLPDAVIESTPKLLRRSKMPIVKVKYGPKVMNMVADEKIFDMIPLKKEVRATVSGIYITDVRGLHGSVEVPQTTKKKGLLSRLRGKAVAERDKQIEAAKQDVQGSSNASSGVQNAKVKSATKKKYRPKKKRK